MSSTDFGLQPIVVKFDKLDPLSNIYNQVEFVFPHRAHPPDPVPPFLWGASPATPRTPVEQRKLTIDGIAGTWMPRYSDAPGEPRFPALRRHQSCLLRPP